MGDFADDLAEGTAAALVEDAGAGLAVRLATAAVLAAAFAAVAVLPPVEIGDFKAWSPTATAQPGSPATLLRM